VGAALAVKKIHEERHGQECPCSVPFVFLRVLRVLRVLEIVWIKYSFSDKEAVLGLSVSRGSCNVKNVNVLPNDMNEMDKNSSNKKPADKPSP
jgi:hypothetical protein